MKIGTNVCYCSTLNKDGTPKRANMLATTTKSIPFTASDGEKVIFLKGKAGYVSMENIIDVTYPKP